MSMRDLERSVWNECKKVANRPKLKLKELLEWSTSEEQVKKNAKREDEIVVYCPEHQVWCAIPK